MEKYIFNNDGSFNFPIDIMFIIFNYLKKEYIWISLTCKYWNKFFLEHVNELDFFPYSDHNGKIKPIILENIGYFINNEKTKMELKIYENDQKINEKIEADYCVVYEMPKYNLLKKLRICKFFKGNIKLIAEFPNLESLILDGNFITILETPKLEYLKCESIINFKKSPPLKILDINHDSSDQIMIYISKFPTLLSLKAKIFNCRPIKLFKYVCEFTKIERLSILGGIYFQNLNIGIFLGIIH
jgi:hypothetical protein